MDMRLKDRGNLYISPNVYNMKSDEYGLHLRSEIHNKNYELNQQQVNYATQEYARQLVSSMLEAGQIPSQELLAMAGIQNLPDFTGLADFFKKQNEFG